MDAVAGYDRVEVAGELLRRRLFDVQGHEFHVVTPREPLPRRTHQGCRDIGKRKRERYA